jgi:hypothetical protein
VGDVSSLWLRGDDLQDHDLLCLAYIRRLYWLEVQSNSLTDRAFDSLSNIHTLQYLGLVGDRFTGRSATQFAVQNPLYGLRLGGSGFIDEEFAGFGSRSLFSLEISGPRIGDRALTAFTNGRSIQKLVVRNSAVSPRGLAEALQNFRINLELHLDASQVDALLIQEFARAGMPHYLSIDQLTGDEPWLADLSKFTSIAVLSVECRSDVSKKGRERIIIEISKTSAANLTLGAAPFDDSDLAALKNMSSLKYLDVNPKTTTAAGRNALRKALPGVEITPPD